MTDKTAFEDYWINNYGPNWECFITLTQKLACEHAWNAAIDAAILVCREVTEWHDHCTSGAKECDTLIQRLKSE